MTYSGQLTYGGGAPSEPNPESYTYTYSGYLGVAIAINRQEDGATVAVIQPDGTIHPDYTNNPLTQQWLDDTPDWEDVITALPEAE